MNFEQNPNFLKNKYDLHKTPEVKSASFRTEKRRDEKVPQKPEAQIQNYLDRFKEIIDRPDEHKREQGLEALKKVLSNNLVIKREDIPESYFKNQQRLAREQGHGNIEIEEDQRNQLSEVIITDQKSSLDNWIDYLSSPDAMYPDWLKYYTFRSISQIGKYDKEKKEFSKRTKNTTEPFPDINREALAYVLDAIEKKYQPQVKQQKETDEEQRGLAGGLLTEEEKQARQEEQKKFAQILQSENFAKLYAWAIDKVTPASKERLKNIEGRWIKYNKNSDHLPLVKSLQGHGTGWCTAGESTARAQLEGGDFYVYYSNDEKNNSNIPRVAIRMNGNNIGEVRGIAPDQNLDPYISPAVDEKLLEFGSEGKKYQKKSSDMKKLTEIDNRFKKGGELDKEDLRFLHQVDSKINGFGYKDDPRVKEILNGRDTRSDLPNVFGCRPEQISFTKKEALNGDIVFHCGDLDLSSLKSANGLKLPNSVGGYLDLSGLTSTEDLKLPDSIGENLDLSSLKSANGLKFPDSIGGDLYLSSLTSANGLKLPDSISGSLGLSSLTSANGLKLPDSIGGGLDLSGLTSAEGLKLPDSIGGYLNLRNLKSTDGLELPNSIGGYLSLEGLTSANGLKLPDSISGYLNLERLTSVDGLELPDSIGGFLNLDGLTSANGLKLPDSIGGNLHLNGLTSTNGLELPDLIDGGLYLSGLTSADKQKLREKYPNLADKI